jgi:glycosyltransferase involved in cell wall biosynthesis
MFDEVIQETTITKDKNLITFVARIDPRKNQLRFLQSMMDTNYKIRFIGNPGPNSLGYLKKLKVLAETRGNVEFISHITQREVFENMLEAKLNVLTSWVETPGLVSLEAVYAKCNILVSKKGSVVDYFKDYAFYCAPDNISEIKLQAIKAMNAEFDETFRDLIKSDYSWEVTANQTLDAYKKVLNE